MGLHRSMFWKLGEMFGTFSFHLSNIENLWDLKQDKLHGMHCPKSWSVLYAKLAWPTHPNRTIWNPDFNCMTPLFVYGYLSIKKLGWLCVNSDLGPNMVHVLYITNNSCWCCVRVLVPFPFPSYITYQNSYTTHQSIRWEKAKIMCTIKGYLYCFV